MTKFYSPNRLREEKFSNSGSKYLPKMKWIFNEETKTNEFVKDGEFNLYNIIQASRDSTDIHQITKKIAITNDYGLLYQRDANFTDAVVLPNDLRSMAELDGNLRKQFNEYDERFKKLFKDYDDYISCILSGDILDRANKYNEQVLANISKGGNNNE